MKTCLAPLLGGLALAAAAVGPALAGDFATFAPIGFSPDGRVFAFEQYGVQDGSGYPYSEIVFIDLDKDAFVAPAPIEVLSQTDGATLAATRAEARKRAAELLSTYKPEEDPGTVVAANPPTEASADFHRVSFRPRTFEPWPDEPTELSIELMPMAGADYCADLGDGAPFGYRLAARAPGAAEAKVLHADASIPESRGCPLDYQLSAVVVSHLGEGGPRAVAIIGVKSMGFEGPDLRFIAEPVPLG